MALLMSPFEDSTIISRTSFDGGLVKLLDEKWLLTIACRAFRRRVGAIGLKLFFLKKSTNQTRKTIQKERKSPYLCDVGPT